MGVIKAHHTKVDTTGAWDGSAEVKKLQTPITGDVANGMFAYFESRGPDENKDGWPDNKDAYKFPHHNVDENGKPGDANLSGVNAAMSRIGQADLPVSNIAGIKEHLQAHKDDAEAIGLSRSTMENTIQRLIGYLSAFVDQIANLVKRDVSMQDIYIFVQDQLMQEDPNYTASEDAPVGDQPIPMSYVLDVRTDGTGISVIITKSDGKLYKAPVTVGADNSISVGEYVEVAIEYMPTARAVSIKRQADGKVRWFAMPACTAVLNRSGEIDSRDLFDSFISTIERTKEYPILDFFHMGESIQLGRADWVGRDGFAYCASGLFDETPIARAAIKALETDPEYWGLSIAYVPTQEPETIRSADGVSVNVYNTGINRFISLLPEDTAASIMTSISTQTGVNRMNEKVKSALEKLTGDDKALLEEYVLKLDGINRTVEAENMVRREGETTTKETHTLETTAPAQPVQPAAQVSEVRALAPDDLMTILNSAEFENKVTEIVKKLQESGEEASEEFQEDATGSDPQPSAEVTELRALLATLTEKIAAVSTDVTALSKTREAQVQEVLDDMPEKLLAQKQVIRPRAIVMPADLKRGKVDMAAVAAETLEAMSKK